MAESEAVEALTIVGRVLSKGTGLALARGRLRVGREQHDRRIGDRVTLGLDDGTERSVTARPDDVIVDPQIEQTAPWSELAQTRLGALFSDKAPGEHVEVELVGFAIEPDARVAVHGDVTGTQLVARTIVIVASRDDAAACKEAERLAREAAERARKAQQQTPQQPRKRTEPKRRVPRPWKLMAPILGVIGGGLAIAAVADAVRAEPILDGYFIVPTTTLAGVFLVIALAMRLSRPPFEADDTHQGKHPKHPTWAIGKLSFWMLVLGTFASILPIAGLSYLAVLALGYLAWCIHRHRWQLRIARLLLFGPRAHVGAPGPGYGRFEGLVATSAAQLVERCVDYVQRSSTHEVTRHKDGVAHKHEETSYWIEGRGNASQLAPFSIRSGDREIEVKGARALWGTPIEYLAPTNDARFETRGRIRDGDHVVVLVRIHDEDGIPTIHAEGAEALVMFGARERPRAVLRTLMLDWFANATALVAIAAGSVALLVALLLREPPPKQPAPPPPSLPAERG